ncbi:head GIN domain-containing protein [Massilia horti]|uniref:DUF2807 domain-containing protein n=1 Tax=Massilia horti TaxID=2562153 RepID=A0A4Y9T141_9BURK|nr:head GIN domain-containing protein [Massilia horti]TFW31591.1 DUF2807 domain-containing protein [Massilia horti]TFW31616.1 DUF2807 domain-containing protein [Massilia horti]
MNNTFTQRRRSLLLAACAVALAAPVPQALAFSFWGEKVQGSGRVITQAREVGHFQGLSLDVPGNVELRIGNSESVTVETDDNLQPLVETVVEDGMLKIRPSRRNLNLNTRTLRIVVQARTIDRLNVAGSGSVSADALRAPKLDLHIGGSGNISVKGVDTDALVINLGGSGALVTGSGNARQVSVKIAGSGNVDVGRVKAEDVSVKVAGSGDTTAWATKTLAVKIAGSGDIKYYGDPALSRSVAGSGDVKRLGDAPR